MRIVLSLLVVAAASAPADNYRLERPLPVFGTDFLLQYDDGSAYWLTWDGLYRGVWFDLWDFMPYWDETNIAASEWWFYHHGSYPWDASSFLAEIWTDSSQVPATQLASTSVTALHYAPCFAYYPWPDWLEIGRLTWAIENTEMSSGGWPSVLGENTPQYADHSFYSDDFVVWEPWVTQGPTANDYFIRLDYEGSLQSRTWGSIKTLF